MGLMQRGVVFAIGTFSNAVLFLFLSRALLPLLETGQSIAGDGPATAALNNLPIAIQLAMGLLQLGLIAYLLGGLGEERASQRRPLP